MNEHDENFMQIAIAAAMEAKANGEVPIGSCLVDHSGNVIASGANRTITDITFLLGFGDQSSFSRAFKRWSGLAPTTYRERRLANV